MGREYNIIGDAIIAKQTASKQSLEIKKESNKRKVKMEAKINKNINFLTVQKMIYRLLN